MNNDGVRILSSSRFVRVYAVSPTGVSSIKNVICDFRSYSAFEASRTHPRPFVDLASLSLYCLWLSIGTSEANPNLSIIFQRYFSIWISNTRTKFRDKDLPGNRAPKKNS